MARRRIGFGVLLGLLASASVSAQGFSWPEKPENLKVLDVHGSELGNVMRTFAGALGVRCQYCHAAREGQELDPMDLTSFDFASDENPMKDKARTMLRMVSAINGTHLAELDVAASERLSVSCFTCHHGVEKPQRLEDVLADAVAADGADAAVETYHELREQYYGSAAYNFRPGALGWLGEQLMDQGELEAAIRILKLENEQHPDYAWGHYLSATAHDEAGDRATAIEHMQKAVDVASPNQKNFMTRALEELK